MRTTVDIPDALYRQLRARAAREGTSSRALILEAIEDALTPDRQRAGRRVSLPIVRSRRPGRVVLDNAVIYDIAFP
jgi:plasmid stability protein